MVTEATVAHDAPALTGDTPAGYPDWVPENLQRNVYLDYAAST